MRQADAMNVGEVFADLSGISHEGMAIRVLHLEVRRKILRYRAEHQHRATLVRLAEQGNQHRPWSRKIHLVDFDALLELRIIFEQANHLRTARAVIRLPLILEVPSDEIQLVWFHAILSDVASFLKNDCPTDLAHWRRAFSTQTILRSDQSAEHLHKDVFTSLFGRVNQNV